jgi:hypothetical protein
MYTATLFDCRLPPAAKTKATEEFCEALEAALGGIANVAPAYQAYMTAFAAYEELPLPAEARSEERAAVARWENAEQAGQRAAFDGYSDLGGAHFEITV